MRDYAAVFRFQPDQELNLFPNYQVDERAFRPIRTRRASCCSVGPPHPIASKTGSRIDCSRSRLWPPPDSRTTAWPTLRVTARKARPTTAPLAASRFQGSWSPARSRMASTALPRGGQVSRRHRVGGAHILRTHRLGRPIVGAVVPAPGRFTGVFENSDVFLKMLRASVGGYASPASRRLEKSSSREVCASSGRSNASCLEAPCELYSLYWARRYPPPIDEDQSPASDRIADGSGRTSGSTPMPLGLQPQSLKVVPVTRRPPRLAPVIACRRRPRPPPRPAAAHPRRRPAVALRRDGDQRWPGPSPRRR